jgi:hypothetical protein
MKNFSRKDAKFAKTSQDLLYSLRFFAPLREIPIFLSLDLSIKNFL